MGMLTTSRILYRGFQITFFSSIPIFSSRIATRDRKLSRTTPKAPCNSTWETLSIKVSTALLGSSTFIPVMTYASINVSVTRSTCDNLVGIAFPRLWPSPPVVSLHLISDKPRTISRKAYNGVKFSWRSGLWEANWRMPMMPCHELH